MKKFRELCKKQFLIASAILFVVFTAVLVIVSCLPHGSKYVYSGETEYNGKKAKVQVIMTFKGDEVTTQQKIYLDGKEFGEETKGVTANYKVEKGVLKTGKGDLLVDTAKINSYKLTPLSNDLAKTFGVESLSLTCTANVAIEIISIVMMSVSGIAFLVCIVIYCQDKTKKSHTQKKSK